ncbi:MAG: peptide chain release factor N(5)-glutamine methyltransferase [Candidatus Staskawiczbacteria bacterium]|nr:peptide chain release factor N(5)-glutamine methyltransferase [Candidatus Staskawiczbacteria bacterium]
MDINKEIGWLLKEKHKGKKTTQFKKDIERLKAGEPLAYVIGFTEFLGSKIDLSKKPLIPRPETEFWAGLAIEGLKNLLKIENCKLKIRCLDMFAGSGCIGLAVLKNIKNAQVVFADNDKDCISQIKINLKLNLSPIRANCSVVKSDVFSKVVGKYDFIFANPPYIPVKNKNKIQKSVLEYEPKVALFGGRDGLFYINKFLKQAKNYLNPGGKIFMEFDPPQKKQIEKLLRQYKYKNWEFRKDQYGKYRWASIS